MSRSWAYSINSKTNKKNLNCIMRQNKTKDYILFDFRIKKFLCVFYYEMFLSTKKVNSNSVKIIHCENSGIKVSKVLHFFIFMNFCILLFAFVLF